MRQRVFSLTLLILLTGCGREALIFETSEIENGRWAFSDTRRINVNVNDTTTPYNYQLLVRQGGDYAWQNLVVYLKTYYPNNTYQVDTLNCILAEPNGAWRGEGLGDLIDNRILFRMNEPFSMSGNYIFELQHAMRMDTVSEVYDIGLCIEKSVN